MHQRDVTAPDDRPGRRSGDTWQRVAVAALVLVLGALFALQITPAFEHGQAAGAFTIGAACALVMFGMALLLRPWAHDDIGHYRHPLDAERRSRVWYRAGAIGITVSLVILLLVQFGAIHASSTPEIERLAIVLEVFAIVWLARLATSVPHDATAR